MTFDAETFVKNMLHGLAQHQIDAVCAELLRRQSLTHSSLKSAYPYHKDYGTFVATLGFQAAVATLQRTLVAEAPANDITAEAILACKVLDYTAFNILQLGYINSPDGHSSGMIPAVRYLRERTNCALGAAKEIVDAEMGFMRYTWDQYRGINSPRINAFMALESQRFKTLDEFVEKYKEEGSK